MNKQEKEILARFLDEQGRVASWPTARAKQLLVLEHLARGFAKGRDYTEREVNGVLEELHTFGDLFLLRRELVEARLLSRVRDGSRYWKTEEACAEQKERTRQADAGKEAAAKL